MEGGKNSEASLIRCSIDESFGDENSGALVGAVASFQYKPPMEGGEGKNSGELGCSLLSAGGGLARSASNDNVEGGRGSQLGE